MRMRLRRREAPQLGVLGALALTATLLSVAAGSGSTGRQQEDLAGAAWRGLVGSPREQVAVGQRVIVVLNSPSLSDQVAAVGGQATEAQQRRWTASALAADNLLIARLAQQGVKVKPEHRYARVLTGFSAPLDPRAVAYLENAPEVAGVYPVRVTYPASVSSSLIEKGALAAGVGTRPGVSLPGFDGRGVTIALLDTGVDTKHPYVLGQVLDGYDAVDPSSDARAEASPDDPTRLERHGTQLAGLLAGSQGPGKIDGVAPGATVLPVRVAGWQREAGGRWAVFGRTDQLIAGLERAVDPNLDGVALDAARVALVGVAEPFAAFEDSPSARAVAGALRLDTLVVAPGGNDGVAGPGYGSISGPGGSRAALTVGAADLRESSASVHVVTRVGLGVLFDERVPLAGAVAPTAKQSLQLGAPRLDRAELTQGAPPRLDHFFAKDGLSLVAGRAALVPAGDDPAYAASQAVKAGAALVVLYGGDTLPSGGIGLDDGVTVPVVGIPAEIGEELAGELADGRNAHVSIGRVRSGASPTAGGVAPFSSRGLAFDGFVKPDLVATGVGLLTSDPGKAEDGSARYSSISGTSASSAIVAGAAALLAQARPQLDASALKGLLAGTARALPHESVASQGTGLLDLGAASAGETAALPTTLSFGRASHREGWHATRKLIVRNLSSRRLRIELATDPRDRGGARALVFAFAPARVRIRPHGIATVYVAVRALAPVGNPVEGRFAVRPEGSDAIHVPWLITVRPRHDELISSPRLSSPSFRPSDSAPAVLSFQAGRIATGGQLEPVALLQLRLLSSDGKPLGMLAQLRDLLPGRFAFGLTGRDGNGDTLEPGRYSARLTAYSTGQGQPTVVTVPFTIR
ncbi:MAG TPA: S8 family serine peptidase [Gaiellaceae bacterium]